MKVTPQILLLSAVLTTGMGPVNTAQAQKYSLASGYFAIKAKTSTGESDLSSIGRTDLRYRLPIGRQVDASFGYSLYLLPGESSDIGFGPNIGFFVFPLSRSSDSAFNNLQVNYRSFDVLRPYVGVEFAQRQFQSVQSAYAGIQARLGIEVQPWSEYFLEASLVTANLVGPLDSRITETSVLLGIGATSF